MDKRVPSNKTGAIVKSGVCHIKRHPVSDLLFA